MHAPGTQLPQRTATPLTSGWVLAILMSVCFTILCSLRIAGDSSGIVGGNVVLRSVLTGPLWATRLARNMALLVATHLTLSILLGTLFWLLALAAERAWPKARVSRRDWVLCWFILLVLWILVANAALYPWSSLGEPYAAAVTRSWFGTNLFHLTSGLAGLALAATLAVAAWRVSLQGPQYRRKLLRVLAGFGAVALFGSFLGYAPWKEATAAGTDRPHVVLIGIDSLRTDTINGGWGEALTPNIDRFIARSAVFSDAITPLARTFPSWVATLSGKHPHTTGAIINLLPRDLIRTGQSLPGLLREAGYRTTYATDEVRFSNIDASFGFDQIIAPPMGASDFLLGSVNDIPLSNLMANTRLGQWLFPNLFANRGATATYEPDTFVKRFKRELHADGPSLIAVHLTLPHWPYYWATAPSRSDNTGDEARALYRNAVKRVDEQFAGIVAALESHGIFDNAIVLVMSDHGEAIGKPDDSPFAAADSGPRIPVLNGHGTSVLSPNQYRVVMALGSLGRAANAIKAGNISAPVSLIDVAPTLLELLDVPFEDQFEGSSLVPLLTSPAAENAAARLSRRIRFTESEFNPRGFQPGKTVTASALEEAVSFYEVDPDSDRVHVKRDRVEKLLRDRQYAAMRGDRMLAAIPNGDTSGFDFVLVDLEASTFTRIGTGPLAATDDQTAELLEALRERFGAVISGGSDVPRTSPIAASK